MKKVLAMLLSAAMVLSMMTGCGSTTNQEASNEQNTTEEATEAPEETTAEAEEAPAEEDEFQASVMFCGSTSLYPIISSLASSFTEEYVTWDKVDSSFPEENISIYVAPGGSGYFKYCGCNQYHSQYGNYPSLYQLWRNVSSVFDGGDGNGSKCIQSD